MPITTADIFINQPAVVSDQDFAGGRMSGNRVIDGDLNNLFSDITRLDRTVGRVSLRKPFVSAENADTTTWQGVHAILTQPAADPGVFVTMFGRDDHVDQRIDAQQHLEQYLAAGPPTPYYAWDTQPQGALAISVFTHPNNSLPQGGETLVLSVERGAVNLDEQQFIRVVKVSSEIVTVQTSTSGTQEDVRIITIEIDQPLRFDVPGESITAKTIAEPRTVIRRTTIAGGKRYYSVHEITEAASSGETTLQVDRVRTPVVPSNQTQTGLVDQPVGSDTVTVVPIQPEADDAISEAIRGAEIIDGAMVHVAQRAIVPGTAVVVVQWSGSSTRGVFNDDGRGNLTRDSSSGSSVPADASGRLDYATGEVVLTGLGTSSDVDGDASSLTYRPGVAIVDRQHTDGIEINDTNRALVYTRTLQPAPRPATLQVEYRVDGRWITLRDRGDGTIAGNPGEGSGTIQYATGSVNITLGAEPDIGSHVLFGWGSGIHYAPPGTDDVAVTTPQVVYQTDDGSGEPEIIDPGTVQLDWTADGQARQATDDGSGALTGDATGTVDYARGRIEADLAVYPAPGSDITIAYDVPGDSHAETPSSGASYTLGEGSCQANTLSGAATYDADGNTTVRFTDDGAGNLVTVSSPADALYPVHPGVTIGTVNYGTGLLQFDDPISALRRRSYSVPNHTWEQDQAGVFVSLDSVLYSTSATATGSGDTLTLNELALDIAAPGFAGGVTPASLMFTFGGRQHYDRGGIVYYRDSNGQEVSAGSIAYGDGQATLTAWPEGTPSAEVIGVLAGYGAWTIDEAFWRVDAEQLLPGSFQLTYQREGEAEADQATVDQGGDISGDGGLEGTVNSQTGVYALSWTDPVLPGDTTYNVVTIGFLPVDPEVIGLDPVRLPANGEIPTLRAGDVVVIHHTAETELANPVQADTAYSLRPAISMAEVFDADGERVPTDRFTVDKTAGEITFPSPLDLDDYTQPLTVRHRIEDMKQCTDAQLSGRVAVNTQLTHDYPADGNAFISSALILGQEIAAAAFNVFTQQSWTDEWSDSQIGNGTDGQLDLVNYPIEVTNQGAIRERWRIEFTSVTAYRIVGETVGEVATSDTSTDVAPTNPATGVPYFTIRADAWSAGWNIGNQVRWNTEGAHAPIWINRTTLPGDNTQDPTDQFRLEARGDAN
ncbi:hypothetical protein [Algiphilus sp.]|uniref:hypothetical protein n=1 Tax=Algiphilus sp. TaxID=1872431 RepID=UPI0025C1D162|nr:hypothetical protein [Algiphilus sp.]MCK5770942.1 hypothetical protein [Algiphilus sp.]